MIPVTKSFIPPYEEYFNHVKRAFDNQWLTNRGELVKELEFKISSKLNLNHTNILCVSNGTIPLQIALKILGGKGEVITTPFSYVATTSAIVWEDCTPVFADIDEKTLTIDPKRIEEKITKKTTCILATHVFGNPCDIEFIDQIAKKHNLKVIYDAAHCFGVEYKGKSIFEYGDVTTCSFHATKIFHSGEGGALFCKDEDLFNTLFYSHNFGHKGKEEFYGLGVNGKMSELHAAMGLSVINYFDSIIESRAKQVEKYNSFLNFDNVKTIGLRTGTNWNYSYFPIIFNSEDILIKVLRRLEEIDVYPRRYFYPSLEKLPYIENNSTIKISTSIASRILCLPVYFDLKSKDIERICLVINGVV